MAVITISRQMGSLGCEIAHSVANRLGYRIVWRELINQAALQSGIPEMALAVIDELGLLGLSPSPKEHKAYWQAVNQVMGNLAEGGNIVIVGRAGQVILRDHPDAVHVRLTAPLEVRLERIAQKQNIPSEGALAQIKASDRARANYLKRFYHARWDDPDLYNIMINTGRMKTSTAAEVICQAVTPTRGTETGEPKYQES